MIRIACAQYQIEALPDWEAYATKIESMVVRAKNEQAIILLMPEYAGIEIACKKFATDKELFTALQPLIPQYLSFYSELSKKYQIYIQVGTIIEKISSDKFANRAYFFSPNGKYEYQDKLQLTTYEKNSRLLQQGDQQKIFKTSLGKIGIAVCYDSEFPEIIRNLTLQGASIILVPGYTSTLAGYHRVFLSCRARAIENQCYVATSFVVNLNDLSGEAEETQGQASILSTADIGFLDDGVIAQGVMNKPMLVIGDIDLHALDKVRKDGHVHNFEDAKSYIKLQKNEVKVIQL